MDVQKAVIRARRGDSKAYNDLVRHYLPIVRRRAELVAARNPSVDVHDVESALVWALQKSFEGYDPSRGPFENYVNNNLSKAVLNTLCRAASDPFKSNVAMSLDGSKDVDIDAGCDELLADSFDLEAHVLSHLAVEELIERGSGEDRTLRRVMLMLAAGYTLQAIAEACGRRGRPNALRMWTLRQIEQIRARLGGAA